MPDRKHDDEQPSLDSQAFTLVLSAIFTCMLTWVVVSIDEAQARPAVIAHAPSQAGCARL
jgi:hypothetical protein